MITIIVEIITSFKWHKNKVFFFLQRIKNEKISKKIIWNYFNTKIHPIYFCFILWKIFVITLRITTALLTQCFNHCALWPSSGACRSRWHSWKHLRWSESATAKCCDSNNKDEYNSLHVNKSSSWKFRQK